MTRIAFHPATVPLKTLSTANDTVQAGRYEATTLSAVDTDLAAGNIADGVTIFGVLGTFVGGALAEDIVGSALSGLTATTLKTYFRHKTTSVASGGDTDIVAKTQAYDASSMAVAIGFIYVYSVQTASTIKLRVYMGGVQAAESAYIGGNNLYVVIGTRALSGSQECKLSAHNYYGSSRTFQIVAKTGDNSAATAAIGIGSIKR